MNAQVNASPAPSPRRRKLWALLVVLVLAGAVSGACVAIGPHGQGDPSCREVVPVTQLEALLHSSGETRMRYQEPACHGFYRFEGDNEDDCFLLFTKIDPAAKYSVSSLSMFGNFTLRHYRGFDLWRSPRGLLVRLDRRYCAWPINIQKSLVIDTPTYD